MSPRPQIDHIRRPQLLAAAAEVIAARGLAGTRIADVAERAGCSPAAVLYWFESKDELLHGAIVAEEERFYLRAQAALAAIDDPLGRLEALVELLADDAAEPLWIELWPRAAREPIAAAAREGLEARWRELLEGVIRDGLEAGVLSVEDPARSAVLLGCALDGLAIQATLGDPGVAGDRLEPMIRETVARLLGCELTSSGAASSNGSAPEPARVGGTA